MRRLLSGAAALFVAASLCSLIALSSSVAPASAATSAAASLTNNGYWTFSQNARVSSFGATGVGGNGAIAKLNGHVVGGAVDNTGNGYWMVGTDGGVFSYGDAKFYGSTGSIKLNQPVVGMTATEDGGGYWFVASDGGVFAYGDAGFYGSMGGKKLNQPIVGMAATPSGNGYWLVASDGGIFAFGDAKFYGSTGGTKLNKPVVGMSATPGGGGYWLVASDGGIFTYGSARFYGSTGSIKLAEPITGMAPSQSGGGYWLVANDGGIFSYGDAPFQGASTGMNNGGGVAGIASMPRHRTSETSIFYYPWYATAAHDGAYRHWDESENTNYVNTPPDYPATDYWPQAGVYSSSDTTVTMPQMQQIKAAGIDTVIISWWGQGSYEDSTLATLIPEAQAAGLRVAIHIEPYGGRTAASVGSDLTYLQGKGINEYYIYQADLMSQADLHTALAAVGSSVRVWGESGTASKMRDGTFETWAAGAGFSGVYSYAGFGYSASDFDAICDTAHALHLLCSPSAAPGFSGQRATTIKTVTSRNNGATYDATWANAINAGADVVSITSYNEWHEGTQIEPAVPHTRPDGSVALDYTGAYGDDATTAPNAYMTRTAGWTATFKSRFPAAF